MIKQVVIAVLAVEAWGRTVFVPRCSSAQRSVTSAEEQTGRVRGEMVCDDVPARFFTLEMDKS